MKFKACSFVEAMTALSEMKAIRFKNLPVGQCFVMNFRGDVRLVSTTGVFLRKGMAIMTTNEEWEMEA